MAKTIATPRSLWRDRNFAAFWWSQATSLLGTQVSLVALPLTAVLFLQVSPLELGLLTAVERVPFVVLSLPAGALIDRYEHRYVLLSTAVMRALLILTVPWAAALHLLTIGHLYATAVVLGALSVFSDVAGLSILPSLVPSESLSDANSKVEAARSGSDVLGPGLGGFLVQALTAPFAVMADAAAFILTAVLVAQLRSSDARPPAHESLMAQMRAGLQFVLISPVLLWNAVAAALMNLFTFAFLAIQYLYLIDTLGLGTAVVGGVLSLGGVGGIIGSMLAGRVLKRLGLGGGFILGSASVATGVLLVGLAPAAAPLGTAVVVAGYFLFILGGPIFNVAALTVRQVVTPKQLLGRTNATMRFFIWSAMPLGSCVGGLLAEYASLRTVVWVTSLSLYIPVLVLLASPLRKLRKAAI